MRLFAFLFVALLSLSAQAVEQTALPARCWKIADVFSVTDISAGAVTSSEFDAREGLTGAGGGMTLLPAYLKLLMQLTDANNGVTKLAVSLVASETTGGTFGDVDLCSQSGVVLTCGDVSLERNPVTYGKTYWVKPLDWGYPFGKVVVTPTGHGAGDTITGTLYGCSE